MNKNKNTTSLAQQVGRKIAMRRKRLGYTQVQVAQLLGIEQESLSRMEKGVIAPKFSRLESLANVLECTVIDLFRSSDDTVESISKYISEQVGELSKRNQKVAMDALEGVISAFKRHVPQEKIAM